MQKNQISKCLKFAGISVITDLSKSIIEPSQILKILIIFALVCILVSIN